MASTVLYTIHSGFWSNARSERLHYLIYMPETPRSAIFFHHGFSEYLGWYKKMFTLLAEAGIAVYSYEMHGHGLSDPTEDHLRAAIQNIDDCTSDVMGFINEMVSPRNGSLPLFGYGHSIGGGIMALVECQNPGTFSGLVLNSPLMGIQMNTVMMIQEKVLDLLMCIMPFARIVPGKPWSVISDEERVQWAALNDPLIQNGNARVCTAKSCLQMFSYLSKLAHVVCCPILVQWATKDVISDRSSARDFLGKVASSSVLWSEFRDGSMHAFLHGRRGASLTKDGISWMDNVICGQKVQSKDQQA